MANDREKEEADDDDDDQDFNRTIKALSVVLDTDGTHGDVYQMAKLNQRKITLFGGPEDHPL